MCGIVGYVGQKDAFPFLIEGLKRLEYRGYDSVGVALQGDQNPTSPIRIEKSKGRIVDFESLIQGHDLSGNFGIGHTRWATHGVPKTENAHPHRYKDVVIVHNGIFENADSFKKEFQIKGQAFDSETDTEVFAHLVEKEAKKGKSLADSVRGAFKQVRGSCVFLVMSEKNPGEIVAVRRGAPLLLAFKKTGEVSEYWIASDIQAVVGFAEEVIYLEDEDVVEISPGRALITNLEGKAMNRPSEKITWDEEMAEKGGFEHFMLKEIHEQPAAIRKTLTAFLNDKGDLDLSQSLSPELLKGINRVYLVACGSAWHAGMVGKYLIEKWTRLPVELDLASEFRYRDPIVDSHTLFIAISQSGETADTLAAMREAKAHGGKTLAICNVQKSSLTREVDATLYTKAGPEIGVASTKAFTCQVLVLTIFAAYWGRQLEKLSSGEERELTQEINRLSHHIENLLLKEAEIKSIAEQVIGKRGYLFIGRNLSYPIALEGALKLKEIAYAHAEGFAAGELKHGPLALVDKDMVCLVIAPRDGYFEKTISNLQEVKARNGGIIGIGVDEDHELDGLANWSVSVPRTLESLYPIVTTIPLQLFSYYMATLMGTDVDKPRNLAKSVTVE